MSQWWLKVLAGWLPKERQEWGRAMLAEMSYEGNVGFARGCLWALMKRNFTRSRLLGWTGIALLIPGVALFLVAAKGLQPAEGILRRSTPEGPGLNRFGKLLILTTVAGMPLLSLRMNLKARGRAQQVALALASGLLLFLICGFVVDQAPCWAGVPNCDYADLGMEAIMDLRQRSTSSAVVA